MVADEEDDEGEDGMSKMSLVLDSSPEPRKLEGDKELVEYGVISSKEDRPLNPWPGKWDRRTKEMNRQLEVETTSRNAFILQNVPMMGAEESFPS